MATSDKTLPPALAGWYAVEAAKDPRGLATLLADDVVFTSPVVHTPQVGKAITTAYLAAAMAVLGPGGFRYVGEWIGADSAVLEFETTIDGIIVNGIDMIGWNEAGHITTFKVMVRPLKAINALHQAMGAKLMAMKG